jgi:hypothetical protein
LFRDSFTVLFFAAFYNTAFFIIIWVERLFWKFECVTNKIFMLVDWNVMILHHKLLQLL